VWCSIHGASVAAPDVVVKCAGEVLLPCKVLQEVSVTHQTASWYKMDGDGKGLAWKIIDMESHDPQELGGSLELSNDTFSSLRIKNVSRETSGTYKCTVGERSGDHRLSSTVTLKVTGCPEVEDEKLRRYKAELFMLTVLGIFYLMLIFFTCTCLRKDSMSPNYQKTRPDMKHMLTLLNEHEMTTFQDFSRTNTCKTGAASS
ncbi:CD83 protein, partial [Rhinopomastus cyanomelas]|nr:CD83 protein [Rhinopomastus cyanomelas]